MKCVKCQRTEQVFHYDDENIDICVDCMSFQDLNVCDKCHYVTKSLNLYWNDDAETPEERKPFKGGKYDALCDDCMPDEVKW